MYCAFPVTKDIGEWKGSTALVHYTRLIFKYSFSFVSKGNPNYLASFLTVPESLGSTNNEKIFGSSFPKAKYFKKERKRRQFQTNFAVLVGATLLQLLAV